MVGKDVHRFMTRYATMSRSNATRGIYNSMIGVGGGLSGGAGGVAFLETKRLCSLTHVLLRPALAQAEMSSRIDGPERYARHHLRPSQHLAKACTSTARQGRLEPRPTRPTEESSPSSRGDRRPCTNGHAERVVGVHPAVRVSSTDG